MSIEYPSFVSNYSETEYLCACSECINLPNKNSIISSFNDLKNHLKLEWFICPECELGNKLTCLPILLTNVNNHVKMYHPEIFYSEKSNNLVYYCMKCNNYNHSKCFHCMECEMTFENTNDISNHLKQEHTKFYSEILCRYGLECRGYENGFCGFNHKSDIPFCEPYNIPDTFCMNELLIINKRCMEIFCSYDHYRGRVKWLIEQKKQRQRIIEMIDTH
jgi:hypothetical protein